MKKNKKDKLDKMLNEALDYIKKNPNEAFQIIEEIYNQMRNEKEINIIDKYAYSLTYDRYSFKYNNSFYFYTYKSY